jgi:hypothetical protein
VVVLPVPDALVDIALDEALAIEVVGLAPTPVAVLLTKMELVCAGC